MAMNFIKGLVAPAAQFPGQGPPPPQQQGGPPIGGMGPYGVSPQAGSVGAPPVVQPPAEAYVPPQQWSVGTKTQGQAQGLAGASDAQRVAQLQHDVESLALFARTLLTMLEEKNVVTREQFEETKRRLDMLDGKLDDR